MYVNSQKNLKKQKKRKTFKRRLKNKRKDTAYLASKRTYRVKNSVG